MWIFIFWRNNLIMIHILCKNMRSVMKNMRSVMKNMITKLELQKKHFLVNLKWMFRNEKNLDMFTWESCTSLRIMYPPWGWCTLLENENTKKYKPKLKLLKNDKKNQDFCVKVEKQSKISQQWQYPERGSHLQLVSNKKNAVYSRPCICRGYFKPFCKG